MRRSTAAANRPRVAAVLLAAVLTATAAANVGPGAAAPTPEVRAAHATEQLAVLRRAAELSVDIDRIGQDYLWPLEGRISSPFGWRTISVAGNRFHGGIDIVAPTGTPVRSARGGVVTRAGWVGAYGFLVIVDHGGGWETRYAHLSRIDVSVGQRLAQSAVVGLVGSTGASTGPHLHFEVRREGQALDPLAYLAR
jgi:murein DD-endopeptidase MepM/ murein hydrolase activator NlpD